MTDPVRLALAGWLSLREIKLVHVWRTGNHWSAMMEYPYDPTAKKQREPTAVTTGTGDSAISAVTKGLDNLNMAGLDFRLFVVGYMAQLMERAR